MINYTFIQVVHGLKTYSKDKQGGRATSSILSNAILLIIGEAIEFANACAEAKATLPFETIEQSMIQISQTLAAPTSIEKVKLENQYCGTVNQRNP